MHWHQKIIAYTVYLTYRQLKTYLGLYLTVSYSVNSKYYYCHLFASYPIKLDSFNHALWVLCPKISPSFESLQNYFSTLSQPQDLPLLVSQILNLYNTGMNHDKYKAVSDYVYSPNDILGTGTWGSVYRARHRNKQGDFAIKKMNKFKVQASEQSFLKYQSEVLALQRAGEVPQVIRIIDFFKSKYNYYIVTEYFPGSKDLFDYMAQHKMKFCEQEARGIWRDLLTGIGSLHDMGIYHRDLKLQNVVYLPEQRTTKIIDFGMATCFPNPEGGMVGSPMFMSPQVLSNSKYTHKCDVWSLGVIFYCMVCRSSPYGEQTSPKAILQHMSTIRKQGVTFPEQVYISQPCKDVIEGCLQYEEKNRMDIQKLLAMPFFNDMEIPEQALGYYQPKTTFKP